MVVLLGATLMPLSLEVLWRTDSPPASAITHVQPEVAVVENAGKLVSEGKDPYQLVDGHGHHVLVKAPAGQPAYNVYNPYLPLMSIFGLASGTHAPRRLTDARVAFSVITIIVVVGALALCRGPTSPRVLALQSMTVLPMAALPLATGGDDLPVAAFMLLGLVLLQRRRPFYAGLAIGVASSMKIMAWPLAVIALLAAKSKSEETRRARLAMTGAMGLVMVPAILPTMVAGFSAFVDNVVRFPLGLAGISSPAASPLIGHLVVTSFPTMHRAFTMLVAGLGLLVLGFVLIRRTPRTAWQVSLVVAFLMTVTIMLAPATRIGYFLYPIDLFVWASLLRHEERWRLSEIQQSDGAGKIDWSWLSLISDVKAETGAVQSEDPQSEEEGKQRQPA